MQWLIILCQYLVLKPLTTLTASSLFVMLEARTSNNSTGISLQHFLTDSVNSSMLVGKSFSTSRFKYAQRFSIGLRSGEYFGKLKRITPLSSSQSRTASALWIGLLSWSRFHALLL